MSKTEKMKKIIFVVVIFMLVTDNVKSQASSPDTLYYLKDRGTGIPTSMFGTYINKKEVIIYPFYEYYYDDNAEYSPEELPLSALHYINRLKIILLCLKN